MKIKVKAITAEIEIDFSTESNTLPYYTDKLKDILVTAKDHVIEIEKNLIELNNKNSTLV